ncbi:MAG: hypothetical protein ACQ9MH_10135 [Nitrospinales bacterium]
MILKRCTVCVLPETAPYVEFDDKRICRHCRGTQVTSEQINPKGLNQILSNIKKNVDGNDCIVALSGGRDSSYVLHYVVKELGLNPTVFTYDWGMLTETGRKNQVELCKILGVKEIAVSDNIKKKRKNIRRNVLAWLKRPQLGMVPLFMAGDKHFFASARDIKHRLKLDTLFLGLTDIEAEDFKEGFCGIRSQSFVEEKAHYGLFPTQKIKILFYYASEFLKNPSYINLSIPETLYGFYAYYLLSHNFSTNLFSFVKWDESKVIFTLENNYGWQSEPDVPSTWRTGDASAPFISYLFLTIAGFTENDFLRSNQVRRGMISREEALLLLEKENIIRLEGLKFFCKLINIDVNFLMKKVESFPKLYSS